MDMWGNSLVVADGMDAGWMGDGVLEQAVDQPNGHDGCELCLRTTGVVAGDDTSLFVYGV